MVPTIDGIGGGPNEGSPDAEHTEEVSGVYLVEPLRLTTTVLKFSGTLGSTTRTDLRSLTVTAYAHYVAEQTACRYIFADLQGMNYPFARIQWLSPYFYNPRFAQWQCERETVAYVVRSYDPHC